MRAFFLWTAALVASTVDAFVAPRAGSTLAATTTTTRLGAAHKPTAIDRVLYHHSLHLEDQEWDTIFIGSGIGSLAAAALLAQSGQHHKVLVLEQHDRIGGCCHTFQQRGYSFGTGIHYVGEVGLPEKDDESPTNSATGLCLGALLAAVTPLGAPIAWSPLPENYDTIVLGGDQNNAMTARTYHIYANDRNQTKLKAQFPNPADQAAIDAYTAQCRAAQQAVARSVVFKRLPRRLVQFLRKTRLVRFLDKGYTKWARQSVAQVVDGLTANADLKAVLCYNWGDYGSLPSDTPFCMHSLLQGTYVLCYYYGSPRRVLDSLYPVHSHPYETKQVTTRRVAFIPRVDRTRSPNPSFP
jgi:all-trans-retinol 13,14-reductase